MIQPLYSLVFIQEENENTNEKRYMCPHHVHCSILVTIAKIWK